MLPNSFYIYPILPQETFSKRMFDNIKRNVFLKLICQTKCGNCTFVGNSTAVNRHMLSNTDSVCLQLHYHSFIHLFNRSFPLRIRNHKLQCNNYRLPSSLLNWQLLQENCFFLSFTIANFQIILQAIYCQENSKQLPAWSILKIFRHSK